jgi:hypothetical protein
VNPDLPGVVDVAPDVLLDLFGIRIRDVIGILLPEGAL